MSKERQILERAITDAYQRQTGGSATGNRVGLERIVSRGRRRRLGKAIGSASMIALVALSALAWAEFKPPGGDRASVANAPVIGAERIMEFGGPLAASDDALFVANGRLSNNAGDKASIDRYDLATRRITETDPLSVASPLNAALGQEGMWLVQWTGDMPVGGEGSPVNGRIQLIDPDSGEVLLDLPRQDSAPYDVAVAEIDGRETAWVADAGRDQLLQVDPASGEIETIQLEARPGAVVVGAGAVWVVGNSGGGRGSLTRYDLDDSSLHTVAVDHCMNDLVVVGSSVWAADYCKGRVHRFDAASADKVATVSVGGNPGALTHADGLLWVATGTNIVRVDPDRGEVVGDPIVIGEPVQYLSVAGDTVFASSFSGVFRLGADLPVRDPAPTPSSEEEQDPSAGRSCDLENVMCISLDREWSVTGSGFGTAWVGNIGEGESFGIARFDAQTGQQSARLQTDGFVKAFVADERWMWALLESRGRSMLLRIDPATTVVSKTYDIGSPGNIGEPSIAAGGDYVWVSQPGGSVTRVSVHGALVRTSYDDRLPGYGIDNGPLHLAYGDDRLFLSYGSGHVGVVDPASGQLLRVERDALGVNAYRIIYAAGQVWSPHQTPRGTNVMSYFSTDRGPAEKGEVSLPDAVPGPAASDGERVWVVQHGFEENERGWLVEVDAEMHAFVGDPIAIDVAFEGGIAVGDGYVWVSGDGILYRVVPAD